MRAVAVLAATLMTAQPAQAECLGSCYDDLLGALVMLALYALAVLVGLGLLVFRKLRAGLVLLGLTATVAVAVPLLSQGLHAWKLAAMERREIIGQPPAMADRTPLLIPLEGDCFNETPCEAVIYGAGQRGVIVLPPTALEALDPDRPLMLADLPLERWVTPDQTRIDPFRYPLTAEERASLRIDYVILTARSGASWSPGPFEYALRANPALSGARESEFLRFAMAPVDPTGMLDLAALRFDLLDLWLDDSAYAIPLMPGNPQSSGNSNATAEAAARSLCASSDGVDKHCLSLLQ